MRIVWRAIELMAVALLVAQLSGAVRAQSISVEPLFIEISPGQSAAIRVRNNSDRAQTVELNMSERAVSEGGEASRTDAEDEFVVLPPQAVIQPNSVQVFRIQPLAPDPRQSHSFYATARQVPVALTPQPGGGAFLQVVFAFDVAIHVVPRGAQGMPELVSAALTTTTVSIVDANDPNRSPDPSVRAREPRREVPGAEIVLRNTGNKYLYLHQLGFEIIGVTAAGERINLPPLDENGILEAVQVTLVPPGATRRIVLPLRDAPPLARVEVQFRPRTAS